MMLFIVAAAAILLAALLYRSAWIRARGADPTPTGFGVVLALVMLAASGAVATSIEMRIALGVVAAAAAVYWLDDLIHLSARLRMAISFLSGLAIGALYFTFYPGLPFAALLGICLGAGLACVILTNIVNFYDGADLNLATFIALTAGLILLFGPALREWSVNALACLSFIIPFAVLNCRPKTIYLGDSGSFAFAGLLTVMAVAFAGDIQSLPPEAAIPTALPTIDVLYVFITRIAQKHDLLTRNYLHLYQRLQSRYPGFGYLLPQIVNAALCLMLAAALQAAGLGRILSVILAGIFVTIPFYFACRRLFLDGKPASERPGG